ncbi:MAG: TolC family protein [Thermodesulfobacteriota bacterium]|nr:TolC family protein [Thermodesulfobacteriota bacterium]
MRYLFLFLASCLLAGPAYSEPVSLDGAIQTALLNNASVKEARSLQQSAREGVKKNRADFLPKASATYSYTRLNDAPFQRAGGVQRTVGDADNYHWDMTLVQPLFTGFGLSSRYGISKADAKISHLSLSQTVQDVIRDVKTAYYEALLAERIQKVAQDKVKTLAAQEKDAQGFFDHGVIPKNDLLKSKIALAAAIQEKEKARADVLMARSRLAVIMGQPLDIKLSLTPVDTSITFTVPLKDLFSQALANRPELLILNQGLSKIETSVKAAQSAYYPDVSLVGRYEQNGDNPAATDNDFTNDSNTSVSVQASWTFFEWGKTRADTARARHEVRAFREKIKAAEDRVKLEVRQEVLNLGVQKKNIATAGKALEQARENFRITKNQYLQQVTTSTEVLDAQTYLAGAESDYYKALYGYMIARTRLDRAVGRKIGDGHLYSSRR